MPHLCVVIAIPYYIVAMLIAFAVSYCDVSIIYIL